MHIHPRQEAVPDPELLPALRMTDNAFLFQIGLQLFLIFAVQDLLFFSAFIGFFLIGHTEQEINTRVI